MAKRTRKPNLWWTGAIRKQEVGTQLRVVPYWESAYAATDRINLIVDPGPAFGAGDHPTTLMALDLVERAMELARPAPRELPNGQNVGLCAAISTDAPCSGPSMLDVGTGTGVLAIAAKRLGAGLTVALDLDSASVFTALRNLRLNSLDAGAIGSTNGVGLVIGKVESVKGTFDLVAANLAAPTLLRIADDLMARTGSFLILSGIAEAMRDVVFDCYSRKGLRLGKAIEQGGWHGALWHKAP